MARKSTVIFLWVFTVIAALGLGGVIYANENSLISISASSIGGGDTITCTPCTGTDVNGNNTPKGCDPDCLGEPAPACVPELVCSGDADCDDGYSCTSGCCTVINTADDDTSVSDDDVIVGDDDTSVSDDDTAVGDDTVSDDTVSPIDDTASDDTTNSNPPSTPGNPPDQPSTTSDSTESTSSSSSETSESTSDAEEKANEAIVDEDARKAAEAAVTGPVEIVLIFVLALVAFFSFKKYFSAKKYHL